MNEFRQSNSENNNHSNYNALEVISEAEAAEQNFQIDDVGVNSSFEPADMDSNTSAFDECNINKSKQQHINKKRKNASISTHRVLFATIHFHGTFESEEDARKNCKFPNSKNNSNNNSKNNSLFHNSIGNNSSNNNDFNLDADIIIEQEMEHFSNNSQKFIDRSKLIAEVINKDVIESSGAFLVVLRLSKCGTVSHLARRFVSKLIDAADKLAKHDLQRPYNLPEDRWPNAIALSVGIAVGEA